jgi:hypothetical protein
MVDSISVKEIRFFEPLISMFFAQGFLFWAQHFN